MASDQVIDFDAWRDERKVDPNTEGPKVKVGGKTYVLPPTIPASVALDVVRFKRAKGDDATVPANMLLNVGESLFGDEAFAEILSDNKLDIDQMGQLIMMAFGAYDESEGGDAVPNPKTPKRQKRST
jgi:hypothetical protein